MIESVNNERIKGYAKLNDKKYREENNLFIVEGEHLVKEAVKRGLTKEIFVLKDDKKEIKNVTYVTEDVMRKLSSLTNPPKILAICTKPNPVPVKGNVLMLDNISDPGNLGTIIRTAVAFNYETIVLTPNTVDVYNPKVIRATEGMIFNINIVVYDLDIVVKDLKHDNYIIIGTNVKNGESPSKIETKHALIIGNEAKGMSQELSELTDYNLNIKMNSKCESLNASISAGILMYLLNN